MIGRKNEVLHIGCPNQEKVKAIIKQQQREDEKNGATQRHPYCGKEGR